MVVRYEQGGNLEMPIRDVHLSRLRRVTIKFLRIVDSPAWTPILRLLNRIVGLYHQHNRNPEGKI